MRKLVVALFALLIFSSSCWNPGEIGIDPDSLDWRLHDEIGSLVYVSWTQTKTGIVWVEYEVDGQWQFTPVFKAEPGEHEQLVAGIPYGMNAEWRVVEEGDGIDGETISTGDAPDVLPIAEILVTDEESWYQKGKYLLTSINLDGGWLGGDFWTLIIDRKGRPVWAIKTPLKNWTLYAQVAATGDHIIWDEATRWSLWDDGAESKVHLTYLDREIDTIATPGLHHAFVQLPDGTLAWGSKFHGGGETLIEKSPGSDTETTIWTAADDWPQGSDTGQYLSGHGAQSGDNSHHQQD